MSSSAPFFLNFSKLIFLKARAVRLLYLEDDMLEDGKKTLGCRII